MGIAKAIRCKTPVTDKQKQDAGLFEVFDSTLDLVEEHRERLAEVKIGFAWELREMAPDTDGNVDLAHTKLVSGATRAFAPVDFIITVKEEGWKKLDDPARAALMDHELSHCDVVYDKEGEIKHDDGGRVCCRIRKHDIGDFVNVVGRHGAWTGGISRYVESATQGQLFTKQKAPVPKKRKKGDPVEEAA